MRKKLTIALPVAALVVASTFFPARPALAYPAICDTNYRACMAVANSFDTIVQCIVAFRECSGTTNPPPLDRARAIKEH